MSGALQAVFQNQRSFGFPYMDVSTTGSPTITDDGNFKVVKFTGTGEFIVNRLGDDVTDGAKVQYLVVAGGGAGGSGNGAGGGAGGFSGASGQAVTAQTYTVTVGSGGASAGNGKGFNGTSSSFGSIKSTTGGGGGDPLGLCSCYEKNVGTVEICTDFLLDGSFLGPVEYQNETENQCNTTHHSCFGPVAAICTWAPN
jgi:hypothetical protein